MLIKNILCGMLLVFFVYSVTAQTTSALTDGDIKRNRIKKMRAMMDKSYGGKYYPRKYPTLPSDRLRSKLKCVKTEKWAFAEALTNTIVRHLTSGLRENSNDKAENKLVTWSADRKGYSFKYVAEIKNDIIVNEKCVLFFSGMPVLRTINGKMKTNPGITSKQLRQIVHILKLSNIVISKVKFGVPGDVEKAEDLVDYLNLEDDSDVYKIVNKTHKSPQVKIILK